MKLRAELLVACAALIVCAGSTSPVRAADVMPVKAPAAAPVLWWYDGFAEIGGRTYLNNPDKNKLGKFYRYEDWTPGVFGNFYFGAHRTGGDPLDIEAWGKNIAWDDQAYGLDIYKPGTYYLTFGWDETPHVYAKDAKTTYGPLGGNVLDTWQYPTPPTGTNGNPFRPPTPAELAAVNAHTNEFDLGFRRDTASAKGRWTPNDNWDISADYSHMHRDGTQALSALTFAPPAGRGGADTRGSIQLPKPVDDTTQNANIKGEYTGSTPWNKPFNFALGYGVSVYNNDVGCGSVAGFRSPGSSDVNCLTFKNPWIGANTAVDPLWNRYSLPPDNQAQTFTASAGVGLPLNSRYMGTFQYTWMTQDETFMASTINPSVTPAGLSRSSLDGDARTILSNNVLHTQITSNLDSNVRYRYYDYHSNQSPTFVTGQLQYANPDTSATAAEEPGWPVNFNKQNVTADLVYRPWKWLNLGAAYEWERWQRQYADSTNVVTGEDGTFDAVTNENAVKVFADAPLGWSTLRTSLRYGTRRFSGDYINPRDMNNDAFRLVDTQNRDSTIIKAGWDINVTNTITVTPTGQYQLYDYDADGVHTFGINKYEAWNAGADLTWVLSPMAKLYMSYMYENGTRDTYQRTLPSDLTYHTKDFDNVFIVGAKLILIPQTLFFDVNYAYSKGTSEWASNCGPGGCANVTATSNPSILPFTFPDTHNTNQRVDASAKYVIQEPVLKSAGFTGKAYVKARVVWEKNSNDSWQNTQQQLGWAVNPNDLTLARSVFLGISNPNYNVAVGMLSLGVTW